MIVVVSDTSPIRALHHLQLLDLFSRMYGTVLIPPAVASELESPAKAFAPVPISQIPGFEIRGIADQSAIEELLK